MENELNFFEGLSVTRLLERHGPRHRIGECVFAVHADIAVHVAVPYQSKSESLPVLSPARQERRQNEDDTAVITHLFFPHRPWCRWFLH